MVRCHTFSNYCKRPPRKFYILQSKNCGNFCADSCRFTNQPRRRYLHGILETQCLRYVNHTIIL